MEGYGERLRRLREAKGYGSVRAFVQAHSHWKVKVSTYAAHEAETRGLTDKMAKKYAQIFRVDWRQIKYSHGAPAAEPHTAKISGRVGAGAEVFPIDADGGDVTDAPPGFPPDGLAVEVHGDSQLPVYGPGDIIFCSSPRSGKAISDLIGLPCVVQVADGPVLLKTVIPGSRKGTWTLLSANAPERLDQKLEWAAFAEWHRRRRR